MRSAAAMKQALPRWSPQDLDQAVRAHRVVVAELRSDSCPRCGPQESVLLRLNDELTGDLVMGSVDINDHAEVIERFEIAGVPAILFFAEGILTRTMIGFHRSPELKPLLRNLIA